jgi:hypothetical protein
VASYLYEPPVALVLGICWTSMTGTLEVLAVAPLRLRLDLTAHDGSASTIRLTGDAAFQFVSESSACT